MLLNLQQKKFIHLGGKVVTLSDSSGFIYDPNGIDKEKLNFVIDLKTNRRGRISEYAEKYNVQFFANKRPWEIECDIALPCATQNELDLEDAKKLVKGNCKVISEGANMPTTRDAIQYFKDNQVLFGPGKAANAGGVAVSGLEMSQNRMGYQWNRDELELKLQNIMKDIHLQCLKFGHQNLDYVDYVSGANIAGFKKVADALIAYGVH